MPSAFLLFSKTLRNPRTAGTGALKITIIPFALTYRHTEAATFTSRKNRNPVCRAKRFAMSTPVHQSCLRLAVFASTRGTDLQAILDEKKAGNLPWLDLRLVLSDRRNAYALVRAAETGVPTLFLSAKGKTRSEYDAECLDICRTAGVDWIFLIGYMRILSPVLIEAYRGRIFNIHPSLLPKYPGMDMHVHEEVLRNGETESGCTLHHVNEDLDGGEIFLQESVPVSQGETPESLKEKVQLAEQRTLLKALHLIALQQNIISENESFKS